MTLHPGDQHYFSTTELLQMLTEVLKLVHPQMDYVLSSEGLQPAYDVAVTTLRIAREYNIPLPRLEDLDTGSVERGEENG